VRRPRFLTRWWGLNLERFGDGLIFGPRRAVGCEFFYLSFAPLLVQRGHELVVAPVSVGSRASKLAVLRVDVAEQPRSQADRVAEAPVGNIQAAIGGAAPPALTCVVLQATLNDGWSSRTAAPRTSMMV
jgi:hypothetical protein